MSTSPSLLPLPSLLILPSLSTAAADLRPVLEEEVPPRAAFGETPLWAARALGALQAEILSLSKQDRVRAKLIHVNPCVCLR